MQAHNPVLVRANVYYVYSKKIYYVNPKGAPIMAIIPFYLEANPPTMHNRGKKGQSIYMVRPISMDDVWHL